MNLLFLNRSFWPDLEATGQLLTELCSDLAREHDVTVIAGPSYHTATTRTGAFTRDTVNGVHIVRTWGTTLPKHSLLGRLLNLGSYFLLAAIAAWRSPRPDVLIVQTDPPLLGLLGAVLKRRWGCRFLYYCQDLYPDVARATRGLRNPVLLSLLSAANRKAYLAADSIVVVGNDMRARLVAKGVPDDKISVVPNWADCKALRPPDTSSFRDQFDDHFVVMYSGNLGLSQGLEDLLAAAQQLREESRILFVLIGTGAAEVALRRQAESLGLANVRFLPYQSKDRLAESLSAGDLHLVPLRAGVAGCLVPSKVYGILAVGRPFLAIMEEPADVARIASQHDVGFVVDPGDVTDLVRTIRHAAAHPEQLRAMGDRGRQVAATLFDRPLSVRAFSDIIKRLTSPAFTVDSAMQDPRSNQESPAC